MNFAYLDIETSWEKSITIIGIYRSGQGTTQLIAPDINRDDLLQVLDGVDRLYTYNGTGFDLPVIKRWLGLNLAGMVPHRDLMYDCWKRKLKGGLKGVERTLGIHRDTEGVDGLQAMRLWAHHEHNCEQIASQPKSSAIIGAALGTCCDELELLLRYNKEDCVNLEALAYKIGVLEAPTVSLS